MPSEKLENGSMLVLKRFSKMDTDIQQIPQNNSTVGLVQQIVDDSNEISDQSERTLKDVKWKEWISIFILCFVNLINYMDRFTVAGILVDIQQHFNIQDDKGGLLQTAFILSYMFFGPIFGYLGDRYSRKYIMGFGVFLWSLTTLLGSFMDNFWWFLTFRGLVGIGEASYSTIAPTIISDLFVGNIRSKMLALFYFAIPVGSGMGYIVGAETAKMAGAWQWGLRVTPVLGIIAVLLVFLILEDPERGQCEFTGHMESSPWSEDVKAIVKNPSFMLSTAGFTCVAFVAGALSWWGPKFIEMGLKLQDGGNKTSDSDSVAFQFGTVTMASGLLGVPIGSYLAQRYRHSYPSIDPCICAYGMLLSFPMVFFALITASYNLNLCFFFVFLGEFFMNMTWSIVADILLYVVLPNRRSTAEGFQLLVSHALGDAGSPYLIGVLSETFQTALNNNNSSSSDKDWNDFRALQYALFSTCFMEILGGFFFLVNSLYILQDRHKIEKAIQERLEDSERDSSLRSRNIS